MMHVLLSYAYMTEHLLRIVRETQTSIRWLLDSGAFTAHEQGRTIPLDEYCRFLQEHGHLFWQTIGLDVVGNAKATRRNLDMMREFGLNPMPVLTVDEHADEAPALLGEHCTHLCVAGGVTEPAKVYGPRLARLRRTLGPDVWLHGLGFSRGPVVAQTAVNSVDSSTWLAGKRWGQLVWYDPSTHKGFGNIGWREALEKPWAKLPRHAKQCIVELGITPEDIGTHDMNKGAFSALSMQSVHAFLLFARQLRKADKVYYFAVTNVQDTVQMLIAAKHSTLRGVRWRRCRADVELYRAGSLSVAQIATDAAANLEAHDL